MDPLPLSLPLSQIIAPDAPLLSPVSITEEDMHPSLCSPTADAFNYTYYSLPPSPPHSIHSLGADSPGPAARILKMRLSPDSALEAEQLCLPTHQVFDLTYPPTPPTPSSPLRQQPHLSLQQQQQHAMLQRQITAIPSLPRTPSISSLSKRSASPTPSVTTTKKRAVGERINSKDFIPPDVSGLSKREARLVKNRAAAFLSRQRKREEFETMEVRVAELEQENARLLALTQTGNSPSPPKGAEKELVSEIELLRAQLGAAQERERELSAELAAKALAPQTPVKLESPETQFSLSSSSRQVALPAPYKTGASLGLMVLLCALPTLLSMPTQSASSTDFSLPSIHSTSSSAFDFNSYMPSDYDWSRASGSSIMELDADDRSSNTQPSVTRKLEFVDTDGLAALGGLDVSFDASPSDNGKIRVRIHPSSSSSSRAGSPSGSKMEVPSSIPMWDTNLDGSLASELSGASSSFSAPSTGEDPFLGIGSGIDYSMPFSAQSSMLYGQMGDLSADLSDPSMGYSTEFSVGDNNSGNKRRVRIALKSMPAAAGEGGEWEVQIC
ncbi:hypothetical protein BDN72DRAFT_868536 [Pluteus cervinus]|uniref:Uncharacterized protein n=1 Tax=Pluteus cervinus TaxID=181527 RepID=A0ACD3B908_9AGAR|nr:hypothetical protein BDN72DRAFT_868536 [Pluteus cervinus]